MVTNIQEAIAANNLKKRVCIHDRVDDIALATHYGAAKAGITSNPMRRPIRPIDFMICFMWLKPPYELIMGKERYLYL